MEDDAPLGQLLKRVLEQAGYKARWVGSLDEGQREVAAGELELLVTDLRLGAADGCDLIEAARRADPRTAIIAMTAFGSIDAAVRAVRLGAFEFLTKPIEPATLRLAAQRALEARTMRSEIERLRSALGEPGEGPVLIGRSQQLADIGSLIERAADSEVSVLVTGPSGCGKELVARSLHARSRRRGGPFVAVNAAALPDALIESELFGHRKGAFTDARADKPGLFQVADGGTLFLDEIGDLPIGLQAKLLRVLQEREVRPLGATRSLPINVRVVAATNRDLRRAVQQGLFRADLYYRIAVIEITIPALCDRPEDIMPLAEHFLRRAVARSGRPIKGFSSVAAKRLVGHSWPGNVRELENAVERAVALARDEWLGLEDLPPALSEPQGRDLFASAAERQLTLEQLERGYVEHVLERFGGNKKRAAEALGINRRTIQRWLGDTAAGAGADGADEDPELG
ncbi:MAG: sigma-54 dependent transcriptional regulator [Polyangia bacterium]